MGMISTEFGRGSPNWASHPAETGWAQRGGEWVREGERERKKKKTNVWLPFACSLPGDPPYNPGKCLDWESNSGNLWSTGLCSIHCAILTRAGAVGLMPHFCVYVYHSPLPHIE